MMLQGAKKLSALTQEERGKATRALLYLEERLDEVITEDDLIGVSQLPREALRLSIQRLVGEPWEQYLASIRMARAATYLKFSDLCPSDIAHSCGIPKVDDFPSLFEEFYGTSPTQFREREEHRPYLPGSEKSGWRARRLKAPSVEIEHWPETRLLSFRAYSSLSELDKPWEELLQWAESSSLDLSSAQFFGLWFDDWESSKVTSYRYEAAILLPEESRLEPPPPFFLRSLAAGPVAIAKAKGNLFSLDRAWRNFVLGWLPESGFQIRGNFALDSYPTELITKTLFKKLVLLAVGGISIRMCLPIEHSQQHLG